MKEYIEVLIKTPGSNMMRQARIKNDLNTMQDIVGGYIETVTALEDLVCICNEEGRIRGLPYNMCWLGIDLVGTVIFAGVDGDEFGDLPDYVRDNTERWFGLKCL